MTERITLPHALWIVFCCVWLVRVLFPRRR